MTSKKKKCKKKNDEIEVLLEETVRKEAASPKDLKNNKKSM